MMNEHRHQKNTVSMFHWSMIAGNRKLWPEAFGTPQIVKIYKILVYHAPFTITRFTNL